MTNERNSSNSVKSNELICHFIRLYLVPLPPYVYQLLHAVHFFIEFVFHVTWRVIQGSQFILFTFFFFLSPIIHCIDTEQLTKRKLKPWAKKRYLILFGWKSRRYRLFFLRSIAQFFTWIVLSVHKLNKLCKSW